MLNALNAQTQRDEGQMSQCLAWTRTPPQPTGWIGVEYRTGTERRATVRHQNERQTALLAALDALVQEWNSSTSQIVRNCATRLAAELAKHREAR